MRTVNVSELTKSIKEMCIEANHYLSKDMENDFEMCPGDGSFPVREADPESAF